MSKFKELMRKAIDEVEEVVDIRNIEPEINEQNAIDLIRAALKLRKQEKLNNSTLHGDIETTSYYPSAGLVRRQTKKYADYKI